MAASVQDTIREATCSSHHRLDTALAKLDLTFAVYYEGFLRSQAEALFPLEAALENGGIETILSDWPHRLRTPRVAA